MHLDISPRRLVVQPGVPTTVTAVVTNTSALIAGYSVRVLGADPSWVRLDEPELRLFPEETAAVVVTLTLPEGLPAGERRVALQVRDLADDGAIAVQDVVLDVMRQISISIASDERFCNTIRRGNRNSVYQALERMFKNFFNAECVK